MKTSVLPFFRWLPFLFFAIFSISAFAQTSDSDALPCGMIMGPEGPEVEAGSFTICPQDISFQGLYILYGEVFGDIAYRDLFLLFLEPDTLDSEFTTFANDTLGVSGPIYLVLSALAVSGWLVLAPLLAFKGWSLITHFQKTGSFDFAESQGDIVKFVAYISLLLFLAFPAGLSGGRDSSKPPLMIGQVLAITAGLPATQSGNYVFSTYLSATNTASTEINLKKEFLLPTGQNIANKFVEIEMCESETRNALMSLNAKPDSEFFKSFSFSEYLDFDHENIIGRYDNCLSYVGKAVEGKIPSSIGSFTLDKTTFTTDYCGGGAAYKPDSYGHQNTCGRIQYDYGQNKFSNIIEGDDSVTGDDMDDVLEGVQDSLNVADIYSRYKLTIRDELQNILSNNTLSPQEKYARIDTLALDSASIIESELDTVPSLTTGTNDERQTKYMAAGAALLGGKYTGAWYEGNPFLFDPDGMGTWKAKAYLPVNYEGEDVDDIFALDTFLSEANSIADDIKAYYCATHWTDERETRKVISDFNINSDSEDALAAAIGSRSVSYRCIRFLAEDEQGDTDFDRYVTYMVDDPRAFNDLEPIGDDGGYQFTTDEDTLTDTQNYMSDVVARRLFNDIRYKTFVLSSYSAAVKKAISDSLSESLSDAEEEATKDLNLRARGWGIFGGSLLYNGRTRSSAAHLGKSIESLISVESGGRGLNFIEPAAFGQDVDQDKIDELYQPFEMDSLLSIGFSGAGDYGGPIGVKSEEMESQEAMEVFMGYLDKILFGPMDHIKSASGMDPNRTFSSGLQECFEEGTSQCLTGAKHPLVALSDFGSELLDNMLTLMVTHGVLKVVVKSGVSGEVKRKVGGLGGSSGDDGDSWWKKSKLFMNKAIKTVASFVAGLVKLLLTVIIKIMEVAYVVLDLLMPVIMTLAITGIIFAYLLPMLAYIYGFMMLLMFWIGIFSIAAIIPFYIFLKIWNAEKEYQQGLFKMYQDFVGPYATPIFFGISAVISWSLMVVLLYAVNITFSILSMGLEASMSGSFGLSVLFLKILLYVVYFVALFVLFKFTLGILKTMPDLLREKTGMKRGNDEKYIESLGFEQYVAGQVGYQLTQTLSQMPGKLAGAISNAATNGGFKSTASLQREAEQAETTLANMKAMHEQLSREGASNSAAQKSAEVTKEEVKKAEDNIADTEDRTGMDEDIPSNRPQESRKSSLDNPGANKSKVQIENEEGTVPPESQRSRNDGNNQSGNNTSGSGGTSQGSDSRKEPDNNSVNDGDNKDNGNPKN